MTLNDVLEFVSRATRNDLVEIRNAASNAIEKRLDEDEFETLIKMRADECIDRMLSSDRRVESMRVHLKHGHRKYAERLMRYVESHDLFSARVIDDGRASEIYVVIDWK